MTGPSSERTADDDFTRARRGAQRLVMDEAARMASLEHTGEGSERTADADVATVRGFIDHHGYVDSDRPDEARIPYDQGDSDAMAALDRLVARNQQLQEALAAIGAKASDYLWPGAACDDIAEIARAALASVRARTPA